MSTGFKSIDSSSITVRVMRKNLRLLKSNIGLSLIRISPPITYRPLNLKSGTFKRKLIYFYLSLDIRQPIAYTKRNNIFNEEMILMQSLSVVVILIAVTLLIIGMV